MNPKLILSLGAKNPRPPITKRGMIVKPIDVLAEFETKDLLVIFDIGKFYSINFEMCNSFRRIC
ncbi:MAG: hypothetical protein NVS3B19_05360 [Ginsengibacter sp.]